MVSVQEVFQLAIEIDMIHLAHRIFWAIGNGKVGGAEDSKRLEAIDYDDETILEMIAQNKLNIGKVKLYVAQTTKPDLFAFYYSENVLDAHALHQEMFQETPKRLTNAPHLMQKLFHFDEKGSGDVLYFHRNKVVAYPYYLGHAWAGERVLVGM